MAFHLRFLIICLILLSGCSSDHEWERWEYLQGNETNTDNLRASLMPTRSGARKLSSTGPYRLILHQQKLCGEEYLELEEIVVVRGADKIAIPAGNPKGLLSEKYGEKCLLTFSSEVLIDLDYESGENVTIHVRFISNKKTRIVQKATYYFKPEFTKGSTRIPWFTT